MSTKAGRDNMLRSLKQVPTMKRCLILTLLLLTSLPTMGQEGFSTIEERMTGKEFSETGLSKLTPEELAALNQWLRSHSVATLEDARYAPAAATASGDRRGFEQQYDWDSDEAVVSRIKGTFSGWDPDGTIIELENGMVWETAERSRFADLTSRRRSCVSTSSTTSCRSS